MLYSGESSSQSEEHQWQTFGGSTTGNSITTSTTKVDIPPALAVESSMGFGLRPDSWESTTGRQPLSSSSALLTSGMSDLRDSRTSVRSAPGMSTLQYSSSGFGRDSFMTAGSPAMTFRGSNGLSDPMHNSRMPGRGFDSARHGTPARAATRSLLDESPAMGAATYSHAPRYGGFGEVESRRSGFGLEGGENGVNKANFRASSFDDGNSVDWGNQSVPPTPASGFVSLDTTIRQGGWESPLSIAPSRAMARDSTDLDGWAVAVDEESVVAETEANGLREWTKAMDTFSRTGSCRSVATRDNGFSCDSPWKRSVTAPTFEATLERDQEWPRAPFDDTPMSCSDWGDSSVDGWPGGVARSLDFSTSGNTSVGGGGGGHRHRNHQHRSKHNRKLSVPIDLDSDDKPLKRTALQPWKPPPPPPAKQEPYPRSLSMHLKRMSTSITGRWDAFKVNVLGRRPSRVGDDRHGFGSEMEDYLYLLEMTEHIHPVREMIIKPWAEYFRLKMQQPEEVVDDDYEEEEKEEQEEEEYDEGESLDHVENLQSAVEMRRPPQERRMFVSILSYPLTLPRPDSLEVRLVRSDRSEILAMAYASRGEPLSVEVPSDNPPNFVIELIFGGPDLVAEYQWAAAIACPGAPLEATLGKRRKAEDEFDFDENCQESIFASFRIENVPKQNFRQSVSSVM